MPAAMALRKNVDVEEKGGMGNGLVMNRGEKDEAGPGRRDCEFNQPPRERPVPPSLLAAIG
ncbi:hypothetical protein GCM10011316_05760 [Roseibium aquae]|uniref:Uncharacterized protein n=1 Tax=Roseibium aquae TaxID=1323746 RepID=A0A916TA07_9HYPH|nr:hypothetical protein GCM10011316_05760 [Roseibium aquae]